MHTLKTLVNEEEAFSLLKRFLLLQKKKFTHHYQNSGKRKD